MNRNTAAAVAATVAVLLVIVLGLRALGGPARQRRIQADLRTVRMLGDLAQQIQLTWTTSGKVLPPNLDNFPPAVKRNPVTTRPFVYRVKAGSGYELCATFATDSRNLQGPTGYDFWAHPKGDFCFDLDASRPAPAVPFVY